ncbi:hypothetical protein L873DRAFT_1466926 [Choiromyces venosus 120613-1]|uniref:CCHC-type domain-containing protein n=1 Tax=Choiromyces venosus 120613-1 TaxID=1336337 RepID=A0A3N4JK28_9PEZI|nr:hypothetical protein L873DRAFT_1466926 [Choiromyces venosus 120613-1]
MSLPHEMGMKFTGEGGVKVKEFLRWMESWFVTMGDDFTGGTTKLKKMRVAQLHVACPVRSAAGRFISTLDEGVFWDEELLKEALVDQFHDAEREDQADEDILTTMSTLRQGNQDVFKYSRKVLKLLQRKPSGLQHYDRILIGYYLDGLIGQRLRELATLSLRRRDSHETPFQVVKGVMRLATQLKIKGYRRHGSKHSDDEDEDEVDDDDDDDSDNTGTSGSDSESDDDSCYGHGRKKKQTREVAKVKKAGRKKGKRSKSKGRRNRKGHSDETTVRGEVSELREMMRDLMQMQKATITPTSGAVAKRTEEDVIPLDTYAVGESYARYPYGQPDTSRPTTHRTDFSNRRGQAVQAAEYHQGRRGRYPTPYDGGHQETRYVGPPTRSYFDDFTRRPTESSCLAQASNLPPGGYLPARPYDSVPASQPIVGPNGMLYYPSRPRICYHCQEEGHLRQQCPRLHGSMPRTDILGPEHPDTPAMPWKGPSAQTHDRLVNVVEIVARSSVCDREKVGEVTTTEIDSADLMKFVHKFASDAENEELEYEEEEEEEIIYDVVDDYYPGQIAENPEN